MRARALIAHDVVFEPAGVLGRLRFGFIFKNLLVYSILRQSNALILLSVYGWTRPSAGLK
jgi:hypothetical protein